MTAYEAPSSGPSNSMVMGGAILLVLLFAIFRDRGWNGGPSNAYAGEFAGFTGATPMYSATDRDQWMGRCQTSQEIAALSARSDLQVAAILDKMSSTEAANLRDALNKSWMEGLAKDAKIDALQTQMWTAGQFNAVDNKLCQLGYAISRKPNTPEFLIDGSFSRGNCCPTNCCC